MEDALIARFVSQLGARHPAVELGIGDDSAVLAGGWCVSVDLLIEDVHFRMRTTSARDLGWKAIADRSEEGRVGEGCRSRWRPYH